MMASKLRRISYAAVCIFWIVTMAVLLYRHYGLTQNTDMVAFKSAIPNELYGEQWMGVYYNGEKIGYSSRKIENLENGYKISETLKMQLNVMNVQKEVKTITNGYLDPDFALKSFDLSLKSDASMNIKGIVEGKNLRVSIEAFGTRAEQVIPLKDKPSLNLSIIPAILKKGVKPGRKLTMLIIDPATMTQENMTLEITGKEQIMAMGIKQDAFKLKGSFKGIEMLMWLTENGEVLREESPMGFVLIKESRADAMQIGKLSLDLIAQVAVPFDLNLRSDINYLKVRLLGIDFKGLELDGGRQSFKGDVLEIKKEDIPPHPPLAKGGARGGDVPQLSGFSDEYLEDTMFIQSKDPQLVALSKDIVKDEKDALKAARLIYEWVYKNIEKVPTITIPMATEVLKTRRGDCNEHTILYTALARATGIPTRIAIGLTYKGGYFYYHAWPEIFIAQWIAVDPTLGQFPADAAHIRFTTGDIDKQVQILSVIGRIKVEGLEYR